MLERVVFAHSMRTDGEIVKQSIGIHMKLSAAMLAPVFEPPPRSIYAPDLLAYWRLL